MPETAFISAILVTILLSLSGLHIYWAFGGVAGKAAAIPQTQETQKQLFTPSRSATLSVATGLALAAAFAALRSGAFPAAGNHPLIRIAAALIGLLFFARAIGERRYIGLFKRVKGTAFARWDTLVFTPLCILIAVGFLALAHLNK